MDSSIHCTLSQSPSISHIPVTQFYISSKLPPQAEHMTVKGSVAMQLTIVTHIPITSSSTFQRLFLPHIPSLLYFLVTSFLVIILIICCTYLYFYSSSEPSSLLFTAVPVKISEFSFLTFDLVVLIPAAAGSRHSGRNSVTL